MILLFFHKFPCQVIKILVYKLHNSVNSVAASPVQKILPGKLMGPGCNLIHKTLYKLTVSFHIFNIHVLRYSLTLVSNILHQVFKLFLKVFFFNIAYKCELKAVVTGLNILFCLNLLCSCNVTDFDIHYTINSLPIATFTSSIQSDSSSLFKNLLVI